MRTATVVGFALVAFAGCGRSDAVKGGPKEGGQARPEAAGSVTMDEATYARIQAGIVARLRLELDAWAKAEFETQSEAALALTELLPGAEQGGQHAEDVLREVGVEGQAVAEWVAANPEAVERVSGEVSVQRSLAAGFESPAVVAQLQRIEGLPEGDPKAVGAMRSMLEGLRTKPLGASEPSGWNQAADLPALRAAADASGDKPIAVELSAAWCLPCKELATRTLADDTVTKRLAGIDKLTVDVTDGTDAQLDIQARLAAQTLPHLVIYRSGSELAGVLADEPKAVEPAVRIQTFVTAAELLAKLDAVGL